MIHLHSAIYALNPSITVIRGDVAYGVDGNKVAYDLIAVQNKQAEMQAAENAIDVRQSALNKLMALGLTEEEALALGVK